MKSLEYYKSKLTTLRCAIDELLKELEEEKPSAPKQRQNKRDARILNFEAMYRNKTKPSA